MTNTENLLIRACKSLDSNTRLKSVYRRQYLSGDFTQEQFGVVMCPILSEIVDRYCPMTVSEFLREYARTENYYWNTEKPKHYSLTLSVLVYKIAFTRADKLIEQGYISPARFRNKEK